MTRKRFIPFTVLCIIYVLLLTVFALTQDKNPRPARCSSPPKEFSGSRLAGTWTAGRPTHSDTLIIGEDGKYQQRIYIEFTNRSPINFVSEWQPWHLERSEEEILYLHLEGMRFCGMNPDISCDNLNGGGYDFCKDRAIKMIHEGVLVVLIAQDDDSKNGFINENNISLQYPLGSENSWVYTKQKP